MAKIDNTFNQLLDKILTEGKEYENKRRGVKRLQIPFYSFTHSFDDGFPAITSKQLYFKGVVGELLFFLRGDTNIKYLVDNNIHIWDDDAYNWHVKTNANPLSKEDFLKLGEGEVGKNYSYQWRNFNGQVDQIKELIKGMIKDINGSRLVVTAWNPSELNETALPSCHNFFQVVGEGNGFYLTFNMRSFDVFLGAPFNIASYALLAKILEYCTGYKALGINCSANAVHLYDNQIEPAKELIKYDSIHPNCEVELVNMPPFDIEKIDEFFNSLQIENFKLVGYTSEKPVKVEMIAPKTI